MRIVSIFISVLLVSTAIFGIYHIIVLFSNINDPSLGSTEKTTTEPPSNVIWECKENTTVEEPCFGLALTTRSEWLAQPSHNQIDKLHLPVKRIMLTDTNTDECSKKPKCNYLVRIIQENHLTSGDDIKYNFLINTQGDIYEGRGWLIQSAEVSNDLRMNSYWIAFIGNYSALPVWEKQVQAVQRFVERAVAVGKLNTSFDIYCSNDILISPSKIGSDGSYKQCININ